MFIFPLIVHVLTYVIVVIKEKLYGFKSRLLALLMNVMTICIFTFTESIWDIYRDRTKIFYFYPFIPWPYFIAWKISTTLMMCNEP